MTEIQKIDYGIHTFELYQSKMKYTEVQKIVEYLLDKKDIYTVSQDSYSIDRAMKSEYFVKCGVRMRIYQSHNRSNGIGFAVNPSTLLSKSYKAVKLYKPNRKSFYGMEERLNGIFDELTLQNDPFFSESNKAWDNVTLSYMELTCNIYFDEDTDITEIIRLYQKSCIPQNFKSVTLHDPNDPNVNDHCFEIKTNSIIFKAYDKVYELKRNNRCPGKLKKKKILRLEVGLKRKAFLKKFNLTPNDSIPTALKTGYAQILPEIDHYLHKLFPCTAKHIKYDAARSILQKADIPSDLKDEMLDLLKKASDSATLSTAAHKVKGHYSHVDERRLKKIYQTFDALGVNPITISKHSRIKELSNMRSIFEKST